MKRCKPLTSKKPMRKRSRKRDTELPVTSLMTVRQMSAYLDAVQRRYAPMGVRLTDPEALKYQEELER